MIVTNTQYHNSIPFEEYLKMPGTSYSSLKKFEGPPSQGMQLGSRVHNYLNEPEQYDWQQVSIVKPMAAALRKHVGEAFRFMQKEVAFTADFSHNGMTLKYKGRVDLLSAGKILIDWKILAGSLPPAIERFGYDKQLSGYCLGTGCPMGLIIAYNKSKKIVETKLIKPDAAFWEYQCVRLGEPGK